MCPEEMVELSRLVELPMVELPVADVTSVTSVSDLDDPVHGP